MTTLILGTIMALYVKCYLSLFLGLFIYTLSKYNEIRDLHVKANENYSFQMYFIGAIASHLINLACIIIWAIILPDAVKAVPKIYGSEFYANIAHIILCAIVGWGNSSLILKLFGSGTKFIMKKIDEKTNIADGK